MRVLLIELDYHPEVVQGICNQLADSHVELGLATRKNIYQQISFERPLQNLFILDKEKSILSFFNNHEILNKAWDLILFTTAQTHFSELNRLKFQAPLAVIVHNIHAYFDRSKIKLRWSPFFLWKDFSYLVRILLLKRELYFRKRFLDRVDHFLFPSQFMLDYAKSNYSRFSRQFCDKPISWVTTKSIQKKEKDYFGITVIGTIDRRRRDYDVIAKLIQSLQSKSVPSIKITLAGKPYGSYGKRVVKKLKSLETNHIQVVTFDRFISDEKLQELVAYTDVLVAPIVEETRHHIWTEYYGETKISGNINNAMEYGIRSLIPSFYPVDEKLKEVLVPYSDQQDLNEKIIEFINHPKLAASSPKLSSDNHIDNILILLKSEK
ncbi:hypothetical protein [Ekhidna sp.]|uniref:hypothetical protein n=1 Tax=Ekhidna sp. TaxID=2608089 RepID=UPI003BAACC14